jgi:hypothetical protein
MRIDSSLDMRLKIYLRRESYVWIYQRGRPGLNFGWIISFRSSENILFKDDDCAHAFSIPVAEIESCGAV